MMRTCAIDLLPTPIFFFPGSSRPSGGLTHAGNILFVNRSKILFDRYEFPSLSGKQNQNLESKLRTFLGIGAAAFAMKKYKSD